MKKLDTAWLSVIGGTLFALILIINYNVNPYFFDYSTNIQLSWGLLSGIGLGVGIGGLVVIIRRCKSWQKYSIRIKHYILIIWEGVLLSFSIFITFPHFLKNVLTGLDYFDLEHIWEKFVPDITKYWYIYAFPLFILFVWILLRLSYEREK